MPFRPRPKLLAVPAPLLLAVAACLPAALPALTDAELDALLYGGEAAGPRWELDGSAHVTFGHRDNVLYSAYQRDSSPFLTFYGEATLTRLAPESPWQPFLLVSGQRRVYSMAPEVEGETEVLVFGQTRWDWGRWAVGAVPAYFFLDQVFDLSLSDLETSTLQQQVHHFELRPYLERRLGARWLARLEIGAVRDFYTDAENDATEAVARPELRWQPFKPTRLELQGTAAWRHYDTRDARSRTGLTLIDSGLNYADLGARLTWRQQWWGGVESRLQGAGLARRDDAQGYADYDRWDTVLELSAKAWGWEATALHKLSYYDYLNQGATGQPAGETRWRSLERIEGTLRRPLWASLTLVAYGFNEESRSNVAADAYVAREFGLRAELTWPKRKAAP